MKLPGHGRYAHSAIPDRPSYEWPNGTRLALLLCNNIEFFAYRAGLGSDSTGIAAMQNQRSDAWRDYGNRVGLWNMLDMLDELELPCAHNVNGAVLDACPEIAPALKARGDEFIGHGRSNSERQDGMWEEDERRLIAESRDAIIRHAAPRRRAGSAPISRNPRRRSTAEGGRLRLVMEWPADAQPFWMATRAGPILSVPYSVELNDSPALVVRQHSGRQFAEMIVDQFDEMLEQSRKRPLVCSVVLHPFIVGQPFRLRALRGALRHILSHRDRLWVTRPGELARYVATLPRASCPAQDALHMTTRRRAGRATSPAMAAPRRIPRWPGEAQCRVQLRHQLRGRAANMPCRMANPTKRETAPRTEGSTAPLQGPATGRGIVMFAYGSRPLWRAAPHLHEARPALPRLRRGGGRWNATRKPARRCARRAGTSPATPALVDAPRPSTRPPNAGASRGHRAHRALQRRAPRGLVHALRALDAHPPAAARSRLRLRQRRL